MVAPRVGRLHCIDPSAALDVARRNLASFDNCEFHCAAVDAIPLADASMDFGYSLGVLHHVPDTQAGINACVKKLKAGAPFLVYLYYNFDNRPVWFRIVWRVSDYLRRIISLSPRPFRYAICELIALVVYFPLSRLAFVLEKAGVDVTNLPLTAYRDRSFYSMRTDALDRFGTRLERRFSRQEIKSMMEQADLERVECSVGFPCWSAIGYRRQA